MNALKILVYPYNKILFSNIKEGTTDTQKNMDKFHRHYFERQKQHTKISQSYCMIPYT